MTYQSRPSGRAYGLSVLIGAYVGVTLQMIATTWGEPIERSELWVVPVLILIYGFFALPFVAVGLALFGLPLTGLLRRRAQDWWVGVLAAVCGAVAGKLMFFAIDSVIFLGLYDISKMTLLDMGVIYGVPTGLAWWVLYRRELARR